MVRSRPKVCKLCSKVKKTSNTTSISNLPKTFAHILEEIGGVKFPQGGLQMTICLQCRDFIQEMEANSRATSSNRITGAGKKKVFRYMERGMTTAEAIEKVLAEKRARELLAKSGAVIPSAPVVIAQPGIVDSFNDGSNFNRMSGSQRKKVSILVSGGMDRDAARELVLASSAAVAGQVNLPMQNVANNRGNNQGPVNKMPGNNRGRNQGQGQGPNQRVANNRGNAQGTAGQKVANKGNSMGILAPQAANKKGTGPKPNQSGAKTNVTGGQKVNQQPLPQKAQGQRGPKQQAAPQKDLPNKSARPKAGANQNQKAPVQRVAPVTGAPRGAGQRGPAAMKSNSTAANVNSQQGRQNNRSIAASRRNDRPAPYNNNRQQNNNNNSNQQFQSFNPLEVGIVPIQYPSVMLDDMKLDALKEAITNEIIKIPPGGPLIRFLGTSSQNGWLKLVCADELSYNWLSMLVSRWERAGVRMVEGNSLPQPVSLYFYLQGDFRSPDEILNIIEKQNTSLNTSLWRVIGRDSDGQGQRINVCVDEQSLRSLQNSDFMVFIGLGRVELKRASTANNSNNQNYNNNSGGNGNMRGYSNSGGGMGYNNNYHSNNFGNGHGYQNQHQRAW